MKFTDRASAGHALAHLLKSYKGTTAIVVGLIRGGAVVAQAIASDLSLSFDILVVKKISAPNNQELAIGALAPDGISYIDRFIATSVGATDAYIRKQTVIQSRVIDEKMAFYRKERASLTICGKTVILTDDGMATGATMMAAIRWCKKQNVRSVIVAVPVAPKEVFQSITSLVDDLVIVDQPIYFGAVGQFYENFEQVTDEEVIQLLHVGNQNTKI